MAREFLIAGYTIDDCRLYNSREGNDLEQMVNMFWDLADVPLLYRALYSKGLIQEIPLSKCYAFYLVADGSLEKIFEFSNYGITRMLRICNKEIFSELNSEFSKSNPQMKQMLFI